MTRRLVNVQYSVDTEHHILDTSLETNRLRGEEYAKAVDTQENAEKIVIAHQHPALHSFDHMTFGGATQSELEDADTVWVRFLDEEKLTEDQLHIIEAALRFSLDQVETNEIRVLDWGDGANQQFSDQAYQIIGDITVDEVQMLGETKTLLENSLAMIQHLKDTIS